VNYWLLKTEPEEFSIYDLARHKREPWTGVRNFAARNHIREMKKGDLVFIYHTGDEKQIVGIGKVASEPYNDPTQFNKKSDYYDPSSTTENPKWQLIDIEFVKKFTKGMTLAEIKKDPILVGMMLAKAPRLSVQPVSEKDFQYILKEIS
jgi:predicted RNA-binding protein with PUA-like domain